MNLPNILTIRSKKRLGAGSSIASNYRFFNNYSTIVLRGLRGPLIGPPQCRKTPASRTAIRLIGVVFPVKIIDMVTTIKLI